MAAHAASPGAFNSNIILPSVTALLVIFSSAGLAA